MKNIDFIYPFHFEAGMELAIKRLVASIKSVLDQNVTVCVINTSKYCIKRYLDFSKIKYIHKPTGKPCCKSLTINYGVKNMVETEYFFTSDIDLVYQKNHVEIMTDFIKDYNDPIRVINYNHNISYECYSPNYEDHMLKKGEREPYGRPWEGFAHGNGLIHTESFHKIRGYDEDFIGYGPEDDMFNQRIGRINKLIYTKSESTATAHIPHSREINGKFSRLNNEFYQKQLGILKTKEQQGKKITLDDIIGNKNREWGFIG